ncbi:MAG: phosphate ABC transporter substrate-binding protein [Pseudomonadota bacterium]|nr:phosphate ABC transporter substrate-binding protein [Pseudomonadota bacterium]
MPHCHRIGSAIIGIALGLGSAVGQADVVAVVSARSAITSLSKNEVADIFLGKTNRFPGGETVMPIDQAESSPLRDEFYLKFTGKSPAQLRAHWSKIIFTGRGQPPPAVSNSVEMKKRVAADPAAIGYIERNTVDGTVKVLAQP